MWMKLTTMGTTANMDSICQAKETPGLRTGAQSYPSNKQTFIWDWILNFGHKELEI